MMLNLLLLTTCQFLAGAGILAKIDTSLKRFQALPLALMAGTFLSTLGVYLMAVGSLPVTWPVFAGLMAGITIACLFPFPTSFAYLKSLFAFKGFGIKIYEFVIAAFVLYIFFISAWKAYYLPIVSFDSVNGIDLLAKYAIKEGKVISWIFEGTFIKSANMSTQAYYAPYTAFMQIIYRLAGTEFGQVWLSVVFLSFIVFLYHTLKIYVHGALAGLLMLFTVTVPEMYAYTFILQTDFVNAVFTFLGAYFLFEYWRSGNNAKLWLSCMGFAMACWARSETVFFLPFFGLFVLLKLWKTNKADAIKKTVLFGVLSAFTFLLWNIVFYRFFLPNAPKTGSLVRMGDYSGGSIMGVISEINEKVLFAEHYWGYIAYLVVLLLLLDLLIFRKAGGKFFLLTLLLFYVTFVLLELHFVHFNIENTFRRGFFKFIIVGYFYLSQTLVMQKCSQVLHRFESN